ncbi:MAG: hypothetical protein C0598_01590 [Marinilabiliales bacterium]|nr:MAG: hypothetical protein C0598_01590 [Marinilabiliales bacterium]
MFLFRKIEIYISNIKKANRLGLLFSFTVIFIGYILRVETLNTEKCNVDVSGLSEENYLANIIIDKKVVSKKLFIH